MMTLVDQTSIQPVPRIFEGCQCIDILDIREPKIQNYEHNQMYKDITFAP